MGGAINSSYEAGLRATTRQLGVESMVRFLGHQESEKMPSIYAEHDILIFPSIWEEPFGLSRLEAMVVGLPVVGTATGGGEEIADHERNMLLFRPGDADDCAAQLTRLLCDRQLFDTIRENGIAYVRERYDIRQVLAAVERTLVDLCECDHVDLIN